MNEKSYDLEERTAKFGENIICLIKKVPRNIATIAILKQLIRSGTSVGANYMEANGASSKKDFKNKIHICKKEAMETKYWLRMLAQADNNFKDEYRKIWQEAQELSMIFGKIAAMSK
ncbi:MAG: four helix bundle protein [Candidatus Doudnabacteria bacterium]